MRLQLVEDGLVVRAAAHLVQDHPDLHSACRIVDQRLLGLRIAELVHRQLERPRRRAQQRVDRRVALVGLDDDRSKPRRAG